MASHRILVIDDEKNILTTLKQSLELEGYEVSVAGSGEIGIEKMESDKPDLVLLDLRLPGIDGIQTLQHLKALQPSTPVIMISGHGSISDAVEAVHKGAADFIEKPISPEKTLITIENALRLSSLNEGNRLLRNEIHERYRIVGESPAIRKLLEKTDTAAPSKGRVLITGESGTGKELVARRIHMLSDRATKPFVKVNCAAIPAELIESELFGHKKGSFTGAISDREGKFKKADRGTIFLDEIGDMQPTMQAKLLRILQEQEFEPIGSDKTICVDVRVIAATNHNLEKDMEEGSFREDLFYRLDVIHLHIPPLRDRLTDIPLLVDHFTRIACDENNCTTKKFSQEALDVLAKQSWPGNVRQLRNICEQLVILTGNNVVETTNVLEFLKPRRKNERFSFKPGLSLKEMTSESERGIILNCLRKNGWNMTATAAELKLERSHLYKKCKALGISQDSG